MALRELNLELGHPTVDEALRRLSADLFHCRSNKRPMKLIHGYGSSGKGGKIRTACRQWLQNEVGEKAYIIPGEDFTIFNDATRRAFSKCPELRQDRDLEQYNRGVTFVIWKD